MRYEDLRRMEETCGSCDGRGYLQEWIEVTTLDDPAPKYMVAGLDPANCPDCDGTGHKAREETFSPWPILGWRNYRVKNLGPPGAARRLYGQYAAWSDSWLTATCQSPRGFYPHPVPGWDCTCGIYLRKEPVAAWHLLALCAAEEVIEHDYGYRAARCWVIAVAPTHSSFLLDEGNLIKAYWPEVIVRGSAPPLGKLFHHLTENPEEIPTWEERTTNGHRQAPTSNPPHEGSGPAAPQEGAF